MESHGSIILIDQEESKLVAIGKTKGLSDLDGIGSSGSTIDNQNGYYQNEIIEEV